MREILKLLKVNHYIKNLIVFVPLIFSVSFYDTNACIRTFLMFLAFCFISSSVYILNDFIDIEKDKTHPIKCNRPLASGKVSKKLGAGLWILLTVLSIGIALSLSNLCFYTVLAYIFLNIIYSLYLKKLPIIDATSIALGFILRVLSGCAVIFVVPSPLVILLTFFLSMFFTFSKRKLDRQRISMQEVDSNLIDQFVAINAVLSIAFYITYMLDPVTIERTGSEFLYITVIPFALVIFRMIFLISTAKNQDDPAYFVYHDKMCAILILTYFITLFAVL
mgnify:CR=1 FL=1